MGYPLVSVGECREPQTALCVTVRILGVLGRTRRLGIDRRLSMRPHRLGDARCGREYCRCDGGRPGRRRASEAPHPRVPRPASSWWSRRLINPRSAWDWCSLCVLPRRHVRVLWSVLESDSGSRVGRERRLRPKGRRRVRPALLNVSCRFGDSVSAP